jgi:hypothetical protein
VAGRNRASGPAASAGGGFEAPTVERTTRDAGPRDAGPRDLDPLDLRDVELHALVERLAGTVVRSAPWAEKRAASWLLAAVGWRDADVARIGRLTGLSPTARAVGERACRWATGSRADPAATTVPARSAPATALAELALEGRPIDADDWRACDRDAAIEALASVAADRCDGRRAGILASRRVDRARRRLVALEPSLPDRRR